MPEVHKLGELRIFHLCDFHATQKGRAVPYTNGAAKDDSSCQRS
jgi:hypothetical protein